MANPVIHEVTTNLNQVQNAKFTFGRVDAEDEVKRRVMTVNQFKIRPAN